MGAVEILVQQQNTVSSIKYAHAYIVIGFVMVR